MRRLCSALMLLLLAYASAAAQETPKAPEPSTFLYLAYMSNARVGYMKSTVERFKEGEAERIRTTDVQHLIIKRSWDKSTFEIGSRSEEIFDSDFRQISAKVSKTDGAQTLECEYTFEEKRVAVVVSNGGKKTSLEVKHDGNILSDRQAFMKLKAQGKLKAGERFTFTRFDLSDMALEQSTWMIQGEGTRKTRTGAKLTGMVINLIEGGERSEALFDLEANPLWIQSGGLILVEKVDAIPEPFTVEDVPALKTSMEANIVVPGKNENIERMEIHFRFPVDDGDGILPLIETNEYHDVVRYEKGKETGYAARLKSRRLGADFKAPAYPLTQVDDTVKALLEPTPQCESHDDVLVKKAQELVKGAKDSRAAAEALCKFVYRYLKKESGNSGSATARQAFDEKKGDCTEHSALFVALARAAGLPARNVSGVVYVSGGSEGFWGYHAWSEVWLGQWVPVDATVNEVGTSARYLFFQYDEPGDSHGGGRTSRALVNNLSPWIDAYKLAGKEEVREENARRYDFDKPATK
ncbi:MAG: hypothetical protein HPKKFMNG_02362 [Planctomycetes bacterium]|nr:hypothetical protein [Planctomycetota bacterium]